jgi:hypothetical protein
VARHVGIVVRHLKACAVRSGRNCNCRPTYQASVWSARDGRRIKKSFSTLAEARAWRASAQTAIHRGTMRAPSQVTLREAAAAWLAGEREGTIRNRPGGRYKQSVVRGTTSLRLRVLPEFVVGSSPTSAAQTSKTSPTGCSGRCRSGDDPQHAHAVGCRNRSCLQTGRFNLQR